MAANSSTNHEYLFENHETICTGTLNILESTKLFCPDAIVFIAGSGMQFLNTGEPINEKTPFDASNAYSIARIQSVYAARYFRKQFGMRIYFGYLFNHDSPLRSEKHINQIIVQAVKRISKGSKEIIELGDLSVQKEFGFSGDVVKAIWIFINQDKIFEVIIGTGLSHSIEEWLDICFKSIDKEWQHYVVQKVNYNSDYKKLVSDNKLIRSLNWEPEVDIFKLANIMLNH